MDWLDHSSNMNLIQKFYKFMHSKVIERFWNSVRGHLDSQRFFFSTSQILQISYNDFKVKISVGFHIRYLYKMVQKRGGFNKFPDFFVQAFKIVVVSWQFIMLLLYI